MADEMIKHHTAQPFVFDLTKIFDDYIAANQKKWSHDRSTTLGASEVFRCNRQNWFEKRGKEFGYERDPGTQRWGAMERGNIIEDHFVVPALTNHLPDGVTLHFAGQANQNTLVKDRNSSTPDGVITGIPKGPVVVRWKHSDEVHEFSFEMGDSGCMGLEIKSIDPRAVLVEERAKHRGQSQVGLGLIRELTEWKPEHWLILYVDASFLDNITPFLITYDPDIYEAAKMRAEDVWSINDPMDVLPEGKFSGDCEHCQWTQACGAAILAALDTTGKGKIDNPFIASQLDTLLVETDDAKRAAQAATEKYERKRQEVKDFLLSQKLSKVTTDRFNVSWSKVKGRKSIDLQAAKAAGIDLSPFEKEGQGFDQLRITERSIKE